MMAHKVSQHFWTCATCGRSIPAGAPDAQLTAAQTPDGAQVVVRCAACRPTPRPRICLDCRREIPRDEPGSQLLMLRHPEGDRFFYRCMTCLRHRPWTCGDCHRIIQYDEEGARIVLAQTPEGEEYRVRCRACALDPASARDITALRAEIQQLRTETQDLFAQRYRQN